MRDYAGVLWRRKLVLLSVIILATAAAFFLAWRQTPQYSASATLIYEASLDVTSPNSNASLDTNQLTLELQGVSDEIASPGMHELAKALLLKRGVTSTDYTISSSTVADSKSGTIRDTASIFAYSSDPTLAAAAANAYADVYVDWRKRSVKAQIAEAITAMEREARDYSKAEQLSSDYLLLLSQLRNFKTSYATATGNFRVLSPATKPTAPYAPRPTRSAILGFCVGLFTAIGLVLILEQLDTRLRKTEDITAIIDSPILSRVPRIPKTELRENRLVCLTHPNGHAAETFRILRTNLEFLSVDQDVNSLSIISCVRDEGKSVTLANLAIALAVAGNRVVIVDGDLRGPQMHNYFGLDNSDGVSTVATGQTPLADALQQYRPTVDTDTALALRGPDGGSLLSDDNEDVTLDIRVLTSGPIPPNPSEIISSQVFGDIIAQLSRDADIVLVDSPALLVVSDTFALCSKVDGFIFLIDLEIARGPQLRRAAEQVSGIPSRLLGLVVARGKETEESHYYRYGYPSYGYQKRVSWTGRWTGRLSTRTRSH